MKILSIDTSTTLGSVALVDSGRIVAERSYEATNSHAELLMKTVDSVLKIAKTKAGDVDLFAAAIGPGSFTGLRIGLATAKGMAVACGRPICGVSSLSAILSAHGDGDAVAVIDARKGELYVALAGIKETSMTVETLIGKMKELGGGTTLVGDGIERYKEMLDAGLKGKYRIVGLKDLKTTTASSVAKLAEDKFNAHGADDIIRLIPNYIRKSEAEVRHP
jgi:tRNA threonylcarbamoyladenosine biosynthesis protein TsaB